MPGSQISWDMVVLVVVVAAFVDACVGGGVECGFHLYLDIEMPKGSLGRET